MTSAALAVALPGFIRIRVTGADRARFLHNFCTADTNGLSSGHWCEAFFTNVKARILGHGLILADTQHHEIWMLPGDEESLLNHLTRYIITEDVEFESLTAASHACALIGPVPETLWKQQDPTAQQFVDSVVQDIPLRHLCMHWNNLPVQLITGRTDSPEDLVRLLTSQAGDIQTGRGSDFDRLRIQARFPLIGRDLTDHHLAPEAARNAAAISYTKGCYLGQEPIARLDALGQVRRVLASVEIQNESTDSDVAVDLTSYDESRPPCVGLAVVSADSIQSGSAVVRVPGGELFSANITQPASLTGDESS